MSMYIATLLISSKYILYKYIYFFLFCQSFQSPQTDLMSSYPNMKGQPCFQAVVWCQMALLYKA